MKNRLATDLNYILQHTQTLWDLFRAKRIFITGGTGFIGTWILETLIWANDQYQLDLTLFVLTRDKNKFIKKAPHIAEHNCITLYQGDVKNFKFPQHEFDYVIHAATEPALKDQIATFDTIIQGTQHTLEFAVQSKAKTFLFLSSGAIYGEQPADLSHIDENYTGAPNSFNPATTYGLCKRTAEHLCMLYAKQFQIEMKIARCFAFVGPYLPLDNHFAIGNFIRDRLAGKTILVNGDGSPYRSYQYAADLMIWLLHILCHGDSCVPYNVGSDEMISILQLAQLIAEDFSPQLNVEIAQKTNNQIAKIERYVPSTQRAKNKFGFTAKISLKDAIEKTLLWHHQALHE